LESEAKHHYSEAKLMAQQNEDLKRQVRLLLHENQIACAKLQGLPLPAELEAEAETEFEGANGHLTAQTVISQYLVPFRTIDELQEQNMRLNRMVRELADRNEQFEQLQYDVKLKAANAELAKLREQRKAQQEKVLEIIKQRDIYRLLLSKSQHTTYDIDAAGNIVLVTQDASSMATTAAIDGAASSGEHGGSGSGSGNGGSDAHSYQVLYEELKNDFDAYRKEKQTHLETLREKFEAAQTKCSELELARAQASARVEALEQRIRMSGDEIRSKDRELNRLQSSNDDLSRALLLQQNAIGLAR